MNIVSKSFYGSRRIAKALRLFFMIAGPGIIVMVADIHLYVIAVDFSQYSLLRRLGLRWLAKALYGARQPAGSQNVVTLERDGTLKDASEAFARYGFRVLPVADPQRKLLGIVPYRDVMNLKHRYLS
jgi:CBS domain-containing protein